MFDEICAFVEAIVCTCPCLDDRPCYEDPELDCDCCVYCMHEADLPDYPQ